jgi:general secretion pathway protein D
LRVKPQISEGGTVRLQIFQEVSSVQDQTNPAGIITNKRSIESTVLVDDGQIIALGGLVRDSTSDSVEKVPLLGDIPFLGYLFRYDTRKLSKTNLMVFLRPVVLRDSAGYGGFTAERYRLMLGEQDRLKPPAHPILPDYPGPQLPPVDPSRP